jgi:hypothetical protein
MLVAEHKASEEARMSQVIPANHTRSCDSFVMRKEKAVMGMGGQYAIL